MRKQSKVLRVGAIMLVGVGCVVGQNRAQSVAETTVLANRIETPLEDLGSAFSVLEVEILERSGGVLLEDALRHVPGTGIASDGGQRGSISALRLRGTEADHTLLLIDGMRVTDANVTPFNLLGGESLIGFSRINILRGPQSALYGGEAIGGVVSLETKIGSEDGGQRIFAEGGSFGSLRSGAEFQGELQGMRWFLGGSYEITSNDRAANDFEHEQFSFRVEQDVSAATTIGFTARMWMSEYENPGRTGPFASRALDEREAYLVTGYLEHAVNAMVTSKLVVGYYREEFEESGMVPFGSESEKISVDLRNVVRWNDQHETVVGGLAEWASFESTATPVSEEGWQIGLYANHVWQPVDELTGSLGARWEHFDRWHDAVTWRATGSWQTPLKGVRIHGSYGTGFRTPSYFELFGAIPAFGFKGDSTLSEERSRGWDAGVEWEFSDSVVVDVTWFHNDIDDLIDFTPENIGKATTQGIEVAAEGNLLGDQLTWRGSYTWLEAEDDTTNLWLVRRARHTASFDVRGEPSEKFLLGAGGTYRAGVIDNDFSGFPAGRKELDDALLLRIYGRYEVNQHLALHGRVENLLDQTYEEIANFPGRGLGVFGGVEMTW
jgi:outer membrane cobalamin receptor